MKPTCSKMSGLTARSFVCDSLIYYFDEEVVVSEVLLVELVVAEFDVAELDVEDLDDVSVASINVSNTLLKVVSLIFTF